MPKPPQKLERDEQVLLDGLRFELIETKDKAKWNRLARRPTLSRTPASWADNGAQPRLRGPEPWPEMVLGRLVAGLSNCLDKD